jgi:hypothetical protein
MFEFGGAWFLGHSWTLLRRDNGCLCLRFVNCRVSIGEYADNNGQHTDSDETVHIQMGQPSQ